MLGFYLHLSYSPFSIIATSPPPLCVMLKNIELSTQWCIRNCYVNQMCWPWWHLKFYNESSSQEDVHSLRCNFLYSTFYISTDMTCIHLKDNSIIYTMHNWTYTLWYLVHRPTFIVYHGCTMKHNPAISTVPEKYNRTSQLTVTLIWRGRTCLFRKNVNTRDSHRYFYVGLLTRNI